MNLLHLVHRVSEGDVTVLELGRLIVDAIDNDSTTPIDEWDMTGIIRYKSESVAYENEIVENVAIIVDQWGYQVLGNTEAGRVASWVVTVTIAGKHDPESDVTGEDAEDDDPRCVCGVYLSEHSLCGCPDGFQTPKQYEASKKAQSEHDERFDASGFDIYDGETDDQYFQSRGEYYCKHGVYIGSPGGPDYMCGRCESGED
jgi:hypothetical protein